ncbi:MAG: hypothetical protein ACT4ON_04920 [Bacteroidota bacterium]
MFTYNLKKDKSTVNFKTLLLFTGVIFITACGNKNNTCNFQNIDSVKIDESIVVLTTFPKQIEGINDSIVAVINSYEHLSCYNIFSGKNIKNFAVNYINFDSLIRNTYQKKYEGKRTYTYDKASNTGLKGLGGEKIGLFQYIDNVFYIYVSTLAKVNYINDSVELLKVYNNEKIKQLRKTNKELIITINDYVQFMFVTDDAFNIKKIIPLYDAPALKKSNYYALYERAFYLSGNNLYTFLMKNDEAYETMRSKKDINSYYAGVIDLEDETKSRLLLNNNNIDYSHFSFNDYLGSPVKFYNKEKTLLFFNGKEICEVNTGKKIFSGKNLKANEWMSSFYMNDNKIVMVNYNQDRKKHPTEFEEHYAIDSINTARIKVFDTKTAQWISEKSLPVFHLPFLITKNKIIFLDKDKQNYYFKYIKYNEED